MAKVVVKDATGFKTKKVSTEHHYNSRIIFRPFRAKAKNDLQFRVKFINIGLEGYGPGNPAPIGIAVIGINNYIL